MVAAFAPRIQEIADELLDAVEAQGKMDLVDSYAFPLPIIVIAELLGIPSADRDRFRVWSNSFVSPPLTQEDLERFIAHSEEFLGYLQALFDERRHEPADDLVSALVRAEEQGDTLSEDELWGNEAPRLRARQPLLPRCSPRPAGGADRSRDAFRAVLWPPAGSLARRPRLPADPALRSLVSLPVSWEP